MKMNDRDDFLLVLPSNSSMLYFPDNTTTRFTTHLSREISLTGQWAVGLSEIHIPCTIVHLQHNETTIKWRPRNETALQSGKIPYGLYKNYEEIISNINKLDGIREAGIQIVNAKGANGYVAIASEQRESNQRNTLRIPNKIQRILGLDMINGDWETSKGVHLLVEQSTQRQGLTPACIYRALPDQLYVYTDLCVPYTVGDTQAALLRIVSMDTAHYTYGSTQVKHFSPPNYHPLLNNCFRSIEIDIRDHLGKPVAFEYGTLTVTLHFKRLS